LSYVVRAWGQYLFVPLGCLVIGLILLPDEAVTIIIAAIATSGPSLITAHSTVKERVRNHSIAFGNGVVSGEHASMRDLFLTGGLFGVICLTAFILGSVYDVEPLNPGALIGAGVAGALFGVGAGAFLGLRGGFKEQSA
jgi:hypothetical protein